MASGHDLATLGSGRRGVASYFVDPTGFSSFRYQRQLEFISDYPREEAAHRMLLPIRGLHDVVDRYTLRLHKHLNDSGLLAAGTMPHRLIQRSDRC